MAGDVLDRVPVAHVADGIEGMPVTLLGLNNLDADLRQLKGRIDLAVGVARVPLAGQSCRGRWLLMAPPFLGCACWPFPCCLPI